MLQTLYSNEEMNELWEMLLFYRKHKVVWVLKIVPTILPTKECFAFQTSETPKKK